MDDANEATDSAPPTMPLRRDDVVFHELDDEALLYDRACGAVHRLNAVSLVVWKACDGTRTTSDIGSAITQRYAIDPGEAMVHVERAIAELRNRGLLNDRRPAGSRPRRRPRGLSRRELLSGGAGKLVFVAPVISTFFAAGAHAQATNASGTDGCKKIGYSCAVSGDCCAEATGGCVGGICQP